MIDNANTIDWDIKRRSGISEVDVRWVVNHLDRVRVVDVREPSELVGPLGRIEGIENVPFRGLESAVGDWEREAPVVVLCRSGGRSGMAARMMEAMGFSHVVSMAGGMLDWHQYKLPLAD